MRALSSPFFRTAITNWLTALAAFFCLNFAIGSILLGSSARAGLLLVTATTLLAVLARRLRTARPGE